MTPGDEEPIRDGPRPPALPFLLAAYTLTTVLGAASGGAELAVVVWSIVWTWCHRHARTWSELGTRVSLATSGGAWGLLLGMIIHRTWSDLGEEWRLHAGWPFEALVGDWPREPGLLVWLHEPPGFDGPHVAGAGACALDFLCWFAATLLATAWVGHQRLSPFVRVAALLPVATLIVLGFADLSIATSRY